MKRRLALEIALYDLIARKAWARKWDNYYNAAKATTYAIAWQYSPKSIYYPKVTDVWTATDKLDKLPLTSLIHIAKNSSFFAQTFCEAYDNRVKA